MAPKDVIAYTTGVAGSTTLDYSMWKDVFNNMCNAPVCGALKYTFIDADSLSTLGF